MGWPISRDTQPSASQSPSGSLVVGDAQARIHHGVINKIAQLRRVLPGCNHQVQHADIFVFALLGHGHFQARKSWARARNFRLEQDINLRAKDEPSTNHFQNWRVGNYRGNQCISRLESIVSCRIFVQQIQWRICDPERCKAGTFKSWSHLNFHDQIQKIFSAKFWVSTLSQFRVNYNHSPTWLVRPSIPPSFGDDFPKNLNHDSRLRESSVVVMKSPINHHKSPLNHH